MKRKILAVDNNEAVLDEIESTFKEIGSDEYVIFTSSSGKAAVDFIRKEKPNLVITAIDIGEIDGMDIINEAKKYNIPSIVLSSRVDEETVGMIVAYYKPMFYLKKPLSRAELIKDIKQIFSSKEHIDGIPADKIESVLKAICDSIEQGIAIIDREFNIVWVNKALEDKGFLFNNVIGHKSYQIFENRDGPMEDSPTVMTFSDGKINKRIVKGGDGHQYRITAIPIIDNQSKVSYVIEYGEDLTKL